MTLLVQETSLAAVEVPTRPARPQLKAVVARVAASLATAVVAPAALFWVMLVMFTIDVAVIAALGWMVGAMVWRKATGRPVSGLLALVLVAMTVRTAVMLATGNTFVYFLQPICGDVLVATAFLGSLWSSRPIVARLAPDFYPVDATLAARPRIRRLFKGLTLMWGIVIVLKASVTLWLLVSLSTVNFVMIKGGAIFSLTLLAAATTIVWSAMVGRQEGLLAPARDGL